MYKTYMVLNYLIQEYYLGLILFNIFIYIFLVYTLFSLFFLFDVKYIKSLSDLKNVQYFDGITTSIIIIFLSFAGIPPLVGFLTKFLLFMYFLIKSNIAILFLIIIFNLFVMFFYLQNIRYMVSKSFKFHLNFKSNYVFLNKNLLNIIIILNLLTVFGIIVGNDLVILFMYAYENII